MILFETDKKPLTFLLDKIENRELALPDFQRSFVWDANSTRELVVSIIRSFPAGTLLLMNGGSKVFAPRAFEYAPDLPNPPGQLVLDGQQRLTSLYTAFSGSGTHRFFLNLRELIDGFDVDEAVEVYTTRRAGRWEDLAAQAGDLMLPLSKLRTFNTWRDDVLDLLEETSGEDIKKIRTQLNELEREYVRSVELYQFPVTTLSETTPSEAVCTIFETLNRTGVKLSVFELLTARAFARDVRLRDMWRITLESQPIVADFGTDPYYLLQVISVIARRSPKRSVVLALDIDEIVDNWQEAEQGLAESLKLLRDECGVLVGKLLPYTPMLITMAAAWTSIIEGRGPEVGERRAKLRRWFWCSVFMATYDNSANSTTERDVPELRNWLRGEQQPNVVAAFYFNPERWREVTGRQRALYRGTLALMMRHSPRDFHDGIPLTKEVIDSKAVDDHHIFPRAFLSKLGRSADVDSVLNHTLIDRLTNIRISGRAPSEYLLEMRQSLEQELDPILESHGLPSGTSEPLFCDDFDEFLKWRLEYLKRELSSVTGHDLDADPAPDPELEDAPAKRPVAGRDGTRPRKAPSTRWTPELADQLVARISDGARTCLKLMAEAAPALSFEKMKMELDKTGPQIGGIMSSFGFARRAGIPEPFEWDGITQSYVMDRGTAKVINGALSRFPSDGRVGDSRKAPESGAEEWIAHLTSWAPTDTFARLSRRFLESFADRSEVRVWIGTAEDPSRRRIYLSKRDSTKGAFAIVGVKSQVVILRASLTSEELKRFVHADTRSVKESDPYKIRVRLQNEGALAEARELTERALSHQGPADQEY